MGRRKQIVRWLDLRDKLLYRISTEENPAVLHDLLTCYQDVTRIREHQKALNKVKLTQEKIAESRKVLAKPKLVA
jgi:hypothetical protein